MARHDRNSHPDLIEALMRVARSEDGKTHEVRVRLHVNKLTIFADEDNQLEFDVELERVWLALTLDGFEDVPGSHFGERESKQPIAIEHKLTVETTKQVEASSKIEGAFSVDATGAIKASASVNGTASGSIGAKTSEAIVAQHTTKVAPVVAKGNLTWEVTEPTLSGGRVALDGPYLQNEVLCKVEATKGANMLAVQLAAYVRQRDIKVSTKSLMNTFGFKNWNQERMMSALIGKALSHTKNNGGIVTFSISEVILDDEL
jgi:hypothetical protein